MTKPPKPAPLPPPVPATPPLYRSIDWWTFGVTALLMFIGYMLTLSPDLTLEDSGELATGSKYAGIPHPPGYPVWVVITWAFTKLIPFSNIAFRVQVASAVAAALACGLLGMIVSRGSSMIIEGIEDFKGIDQRFENALCITAGFVAALLLGFNGFMWSQAVIVEVYPLSVLVLLTMLSCILRWMDAPHQMRYLYWAVFLFGVCIVSHQTLLVAAMGIEIAVIAAQPRLGRNLLAVNSLFWFFGLFLKANGYIATFDSPPGASLQNLNMVYVIFNLVGISSLAGLCYLIIQTRGLTTDWWPVLIMIGLWCVGVGLFFYMPLASMSNPPMNWGYPRTPEGFFHVLSRGQYEKTNPTNIFADPKRFIQQTYMYFQGAHDEFTWTYLLLGLVPFYFFFKMQRRERAWMIGLTGIFFCLAFLLMVLMNPSPDRQTQSLIKVFFTSSYVPVTMWVGYGLTLIGAWLAMQYQRAKIWVLSGAGVLLVVSFFGLTDSIKTTFFGQEPAPEDLPGGGLKTLGYGVAHLIGRGLGALPIWGSLLVLGLVVVFILVVLIPSTRARMACVLGVFALMPLSSIISHWADNEQRGHLFGFWFGHDMFTPPFNIYPEMDRDTVLFGGTDPGRFCPTYMIFCESFIPPQDRRDTNFDRRDVYLITQNALADNTYLEYIRAHYNRSTQIDTPFFQSFLPYIFPKSEVLKEMSGGVGWVDNIFTKLGARIEKSRRDETSWFKPGDFTNVQSLAAKLRTSDHQDSLSKFLNGKLSAETQGLLGGKADDQALSQALAKDFNAVLDGGLIYDAERFKNVKLPLLIQQAAQENPLTNEIVRLNRLMLEAAYPSEIAKSPGGVFPDTEIHTPSAEDSQECFNAYLMDAQRRMETHQLRAGEDVHVDANGRVSVSGQTAVMGINGLLTKVIFDKNPGHAFYVEESFPLDWMYPYLTPYGIIMKINRQKVPEITQEMIDKDHRFWSQYSGRMIGNWITYDSTIKQVCQFAEKVYLKHDYQGFTGDLKFIRDDDAQKAFSKLRSSIGSSIYMWRSGNFKTPEEQQRMLKEAEFALKQAVAFCPYSPEAVFHLVQLLLNQRRVDDAILVAKTCHELDPYNGQVQGLLDQLQTEQKGGGQNVTAAMVFQQIQQAIQAKDTNLAMTQLEMMMNSPGADSPVLMQVAETYLQLRDFPKAEQAVLKATQVAPAVALNWYNLATLQAAEGRAADAVQALKKAFSANQAELAANAKALNIAEHLRTDHNFDGIRPSPEFKQLMQAEQIK
jgi:tetratricopeptide (TPR) repeat protein